MKKIVIITPAPEVVKTLIKNSMIRKSIENQVAEIEVINLRDYGVGSYRQVDDTPFGGGDGMVMMAEPLMKAIEMALNFVGRTKGLRVFYPSPQGKLWNQESAKEFSNCDKMIFICGHYKGIDERVIDKYVTDEYSIGDYVLTGGELPGAILIDSIIRLIPGVLGDETSALTDSFQDNLLSPPVYTRPKEYKNWKVPDILLSGDLKEIEKWRMKKSLDSTNKKRPDLL